MRRMVGLPLWIVAAFLVCGLSALWIGSPSAEPKTKAGRDARQKQQQKPQASSPDRWFVRKTPSGFVLGGADWDDNATQRAALKIAGTLPVTAYGTVGQLSPVTDGFGTLQVASFRALAMLDAGFVDVRNGVVTIDGVSGSADGDAVRALLIPALPRGYRLSSVIVRKPQAEPYFFSIQRGEQIELQGFVPDEATRALLVATAMTLEADAAVIDRTKLRPSAPPAFSEAARALVLQTKPFGDATASLTGQRFDLLAYAGSLSWNEANVCRQTVAVLPRGYACGFVHIVTQPIARGPGFHYGKQKAGMGRRMAKGKGWSAPPKEVARPKAEPAKTQYQATNPAATPRAVVREQDKDSRTVDLYFATNRKVNKNETSKTAILSERAFTGERGDGLNFGVVRVRIPEDHKVGTIRLPGGISIFGYQTDPFDPKRHFHMRSRQLVTRAEWDGFVRELKPTDALVFVHGFNNTFDDAAFRMAQIVWDLGYRGLPVLFSWPSRAGVLDYQYDRESALASRRRFIELLQILQKDHAVERVHVLAHSMGNFLVLDALANVAGTSDPLRIAELIMAAPDIDRDQFLQNVPFVQKIVKGMTLYASSNDRALVASRSLAGGIPRAGDVGESGPILLPGLESIDMSAMGDEMFGLNHNTFAANRSLIDDLFILLTKGERSPRLRQIRGVPEVGPKYWRFAQ